MPRLRVMALKGNNLTGTIPPSYATGRAAAVLQQVAGLSTTVT